jgi:hypothetical protein
MTTFVITSEIGNKIKTEGFYLDDELDMVMEDLDRAAEEKLGDYFPMEDGNIGFYSVEGNRIYLEEHNMDKLHT